MFRTKEQQYTLLGSPPRYTPSPSCRADESLPSFPSQPGRKLRWYTIASSALNIVLTALLLVQTYRLSATHKENYLPGLRIPLNQPRTLGLDTVFMHPNESIAGAAWASIRSGHGDVAVDPEWARQRGLPPSMPHPYREGKSVYIVAAYHEIHCLRVLRDHYFQMLSGGIDLENPPWPVEHDKHCFDTIRQSIMCSADSTLLWSAGKLDAGNGQTRMCRDWDALRDWTGERSACYTDFINPSPEGELYWSTCPDGRNYDGLPRGGVLDQGVDVEVETWGVGVGGIIDSN